MADLISSEQVIEIIGALEYKRRFPTGTKVNMTQYVDVLLDDHFAQADRIAKLENLIIDIATPLLHLQAPAKALLEEIIKDNKPDDH